ncbi:hypothetical protein GGR19_002447 [Croceicoccus naphthovorans]|nr:hypothetical protein [Croceicoccus naphthovorans]
MNHCYTVVRLKLARRAGQEFGEGPTLIAFHRPFTASQGMSFPGTEAVWSKVQPADKSTAEPCEES